MKNNIRFMVTLILLFAVVLGAQPALASTITNALYYGTIRVVNNSTACTNVTSNITNIHTQTLIDGGYITAANTSNLVLRDNNGDDVAFMPGYSTNAWMTFVPTIGEDTTVDYTLYMNSVADGKIRYFPTSAGMTILDDATMEPAANFSIAFSGYVDTSVADIIVEKDDAIDITSDGSGTIKAMIYDYTTMVTTTDLATGWRVPSATSQTFQATATAYISRVQLNISLNDVTGVTVKLYATTAGAPSGDPLATSNSVDLAQGAWRTVDFIVPYKVTNGTTYAVVTVGGAGAGWRYSNANPYADGQEYNTITFAGDTITGSTPQAANDLDLKVDYSPYCHATGISEDEHDIIVASDGTDFTLTIDTVEEDSIAIGAMSVPGNANDWVIGSSATPYIEYYTHTVGGTLVSDIDWEYGATFTDDSGNGNDATPTFAVDSSDADVTAALVEFGPIDEAQAPATAVSGDYSDWFTAPNLTGDFSDTITPPFPGADVVEAIAAASSTPSQLPFMLIGCFVILMASLFASWAMKSAGGHSLLVKFILILGMMGVAVALDTFDWWMLLFFAIPSIALGFASRSQGVIP